MKKILFLAFSICVFSQDIYAQFFGQLPEPTKYNAAKVLDPDYGIVMYEKLNFTTGGDSVRNDKRGYAAQGWLQDVYESGAVLHKGYYEDGHLKSYKNFYENGTVERSFRIIDFKKSNMQIFYPDGKIKADIYYYDGGVQMETDYFPNGQVEYLEENTKDLEFLIQRKSYQQDGKPVDIMEMTDPKKKLYYKKTYYESGKIKEEGPVKYSKSALDYQKDGLWKVYDESGNAKDEHWVNGEQVTE